MLLESIRLSNFRQFYGETPTIRFAKGTQNVTVIHGANGSGKTALLNAFTWILYGEFSRGFQLSDELVNKRAIREAAPGESIEAFAELAFTYAQRHYTLTKKVAVERIATGRGWKSLGAPTAQLSCCDLDGVSRTIAEVEDTVGRILPADLHWYFFFDGERIERLVQSEKDKDDRRDIASASKKLLGVEVLKRACDHLAAAKRELERDLRKIGDAETVELLDKKAKLELQSNECARLLNELKANIEGHCERKKALKSRLREKQEVKEIQLRRDKLEKEEAGFREALRRAKQEIREAVRDDGFLVLLGRPAQSFASLVEELRKRGELPAGIKTQFIRDLLDAGVCICGTSLRDNDAARQFVEKWKDRAGLADVEEKILQMRGEISTLSVRIENFWKRVDLLKRDMSNHVKRLYDIEVELDKIRERLRDDSADEISGLERQLENTEAAMDRDNREVGRVTGLISQYESEINELEKEIDRLEKREARQRIANDRVKAATESIERIKEVHRLFETELRLKLQDRIQSHFRQMSITPYVAQVGEDFSLTLYESAGGGPMPVAASTGESQVLSVAFIGSLIELTKEYQARRDRLPGPEDVQFPVVMDSPFGALDQHHRNQVAAKVPSLADQVVSLVSKSQWLGPVEDAMADRVGRHYVLTYFSPRQDVEPDSIVIAGRGYDILKRSPNDFEYTEIREVKHG